MEAVLVGSRVTDGFTGDGGWEGDLACNRRLPHTCKQTNTERFNFMSNTIVKTLFWF